MRINLTLTRLTGLVQRLQARDPKCFLCRKILVDLLDHKSITDGPVDEDDHPFFPVRAKVAHLRLEGLLRKPD